MMKRKASLKTLLLETIATIIKLITLAFQMGLQVRLISSLTKRITTSSSLSMYVKGSIIVTIGAYSLNSKGILKGDSMASMLINSDLY